METKDQPRKRTGRPAKTKETADSLRKIDAAAAPAAENASGEQPPATGRRMPKIHDFGGDSPSAGEREAESEPIEAGAEPVDEEGGHRVREGTLDLSGAEDAHHAPDLVIARADGAPRVDPAGVLKAPSQPLEARRPAVGIRPTGSQDRGVPAFDGRDMPRDDRDDLTRMVGARFYEASSLFEWCKTYDGRRHTFTRFYFYEETVFPHRLLVDIYPSDSRNVREELAEKTASIQQHNRENPNEPFGYLPIVRGSFVDLEVIEKARVGGVFELIGAVENPEVVFA